MAEGNVGVGKGMVGRGRRSDSSTMNNLRYVGRRCIRKVVGT